MILCDTNILIEFYKDNDDVISALQEIGLPDLAVNIITVGELYFGARDRRELLKIKKHLVSHRSPCRSGLGVLEARQFAKLSAL